MNKQQEIWNSKLQGYATAAWITDASLFAKWATQFFPPQGRLLELGAGLGRDAVHFSNLGYEVTATDFSDKAMQLLEGTEVQPVRFDLNDEFPFADESYDIVFAHLSLHYFEDPKTQQIFSEIHRVLSPHGILAAMFNSTHDPEYSEQPKLENGLTVLPSGMIKRFFNTESVHPFTRDFSTVLIDDQGEAFKDKLKNTHNLIRLIAKK